MKNILLKYLLLARRSSPTKTQDGFTMIELVVITVIIGVLSAIGAAGWEAFTTRQKIRTINDQVFQALRSAQSDAKLKKEMRGVIFNDCTNIQNPKPLLICRYNSASKDITNNSIPIDLSQNGSIKPEQILLTAGECTATGTNGNCTTWKEDRSIFFNYLGAVQINNLPDKQDNQSEQLLPFFVTISTPEGKGKRCIIVETLLGGMRSAQGDQCP